MKLSTPCCAAAFYLAATHGVLAYYCSRPSEPSIPSGSYAEEYEMDSAKSEVDSYLSEMNEYIRCLADEADDAKSEANNVLDQWNDAVNTYNNR